MSGLEGKLSFDLCATDAVCKKVSLKQFFSNYLMNEFRNIANENLSKVNKIFKAINN